MITKQFNVKNLATLWKNGLFSSSVFQDFMEYERTYVRDRESEGGLTGVSETERCLSHCKNMINGKLAEIAFREYYKPSKSWTMNDKEYANWSVERESTDINKPDFEYINKFNEKITVELKCYSGWGTEEEFVNKILNNINSFKYVWLYHKADLIVYWRRYTNEIYVFHPTTDGWTYEKDDIDYEDKKAMLDYYNEIKVN